MCVCEVFSLWKGVHKYVSGSVYKSGLSFFFISFPEAPVHPVTSGQRYKVEILMQLFKCQMFPTLVVGRKDQLLFPQPLKKFHAFYETRWFLITFVRGTHWFQS